MGANPLEGMVQACSGQMPARQLDKAEMRDIVRVALEALNERQRMAVLLNKFEDMSYADIAETMDLSPQAIKSLSEPRPGEPPRSAGTVPRTRRSPLAATGRGPPRTQS